MESLGGGISFPVVFSDGEAESEIGAVVVFPTMNFKSFQAVLSQRIGISPNCFSVFISSPESRRRIPVTGNADFGVMITRHTTCFFLVVLRRSKRSRRRNHPSQKNSLNNLYDTASYYYSPTKVMSNPLENAVFLRRGGEALTGLVLPFSGRVEWENRVKELQVEKERYLMNIGLARTGRFGPGRVGGKCGGGMVVCEECSRAEEMGTEVGFHWCADDPVVTFRFISPAGPISRPVNR